jgi:hypothetical protein
LIPFFEGKIELYNVLFLFIIPIGIPILVFIIRRKFLWGSPMVALMMGLILTAFFYPYIFSDIFVHSGTTTGYWIMLVLPIHCAISVITTSAFHVINRIRKRRN